MIVIVTDFGQPYLGQMRAAIRRHNSLAEVVDLFTDIAAFEVRGAAYLLPAYARDFAPPCVFLCVVDPGVGSAREPLIVEADGRLFVGPDNGLFSLVVRRATAASVWRIAWRPEQLSATFHGRDLFAPVAAMLAAEQPPDTLGEALAPAAVAGTDWPDDLPRIIHIDGFGNAISGLRASTVEREARLRIAGRELDRARTYSDLAPGTAFWYENANGLVEVAVNQGSAARDLGLRAGTAFEIV